jgi:hypothetical protein
VDEKRRKQVMADVALRILATLFPAAQDAFSFDTLIRRASQ